MIYNFCQTIKTNSYIQSPQWLKFKKCTIKPQNKNDDRCFQYLITIALNRQKLNNNPERISKIKALINYFNWNEINFPPQQQDYKKFETNNESIALNVLYIPPNTENIKHLYKSKLNFTREQQVILSMISDGQKWHYLAVKKIKCFIKKKNRP